MPGADRACRQNFIAQEPLFEETDVGLVVVKKEALVIAQFVKQDNGSLIYVGSEAVQYACRTLVDIGVNVNESCSLQITLLNESGKGGGYSALMQCHVVFDGGSWPPRSKVPSSRYFFHTPSPAGRPSKLRNPRIFLPSSRAKNLWMCPGRRRIHSILAGTEPSLQP